MGMVGALKIIFQICTSLVFTMRASCRWLFNHLIVLGAICVLFIALILFPCVLRFFVSCLPILICTAVVVKILLGFGNPHNENENENDEKKSSGDGSSSNLCEFDKRQGFSIETRLKKKKGIRERALEKSGIMIGSGGKEKKVAFSPRPRDSLMRRNFKIGASQKDDGDDDTPSSPDTPPINVLPVIDEIDPLLDTEAPPDDEGLESPDRSVDDGSVDSEVENQEGKENEVDGAKALVTWTEDDEKNLMDLGTSELERNQRLENLIAKRRARKDAVTNLIDFESNDPPQPQVPSITTAKSNPFDAPYSAIIEAENLPPIPSSAPCNFAQSKKNPFDLPYDPQEEKPNLTQDSFQQEFMSVFCRHESFNFGPMGGSKQDRYNTKFIPFFGNEDMSSESGLANERRSSLSGAFPEPDSLPPIDPRNRKKQMGRAMSLGVYPSNRAPKQRKIPEIKINHEANLDSAETKEVGLHDTSEASFVKDPNVAPLSEQVDDVKSEEVKSDNNAAEPEDLNDTKEPEESDNNSGVEVEVDVDVKEPVYDSSPSAVEKRTIDEYLVYPDNGPSLTSSSSIASDMHVEVSESGSPRHPDADEESSSFPDEIVKFATEESNDSVRPSEKEVRPSETVPQGMHDSAIDKDENNAPPSSAKPETHVVEVGQQDSVAAPSPSSDLNKLESMTEEVKAQPSSHYQESQESSVDKSTEQVKKIDNVNEQLSNDEDANEELLVTKPVEAASLNHGESNVAMNPSQPMESKTTVETETSTTHETTNTRPFEAGHMADGDPKQQVGESMKEEDDGKLHKENKIHTDNREDPKQDQN